MQSSADQQLTYPMYGPTALGAPEEWDRLRRECPVARVTLPSGDEASLLTRYADVREVLSDGRFSRRLDADDAARIADSESGGVFNRGADRDRFSRWSDALLNLIRYTQAETDAAQDEFAGYLTGYVVAKRKEPADDLPSELITAVEPDDYRLSERESVFTGQALLVAGHETTANMIGKMVAMLLADRRPWERLPADRKLIRPTVEEALRLDANAGVGMPRCISETVEVGGATLAVGATVMCSMAAANRDDETAFEAAEEMTLDRSPNAHLALGAGPHPCLGQALARTELQTVLDVLLRRLPSLELAVDAADLRRLEGLAVGGLREVPVKW
ncbi:cytochrome P450 [Streptomyces sp. GESEQ-35]|uniref:cytochrome P450 n=1 Tax=Streptomyces sp. GESEQ-35 TaxID=2812657 RepID=UPI001B31E880|nr:cytochrome P450 [Streptomyces sp. GESEQ-35]